MELSSSEQDYAMIVGKKYEIATTTSLHLFTLRCHYIDLPSVQNIVHLVNLQELRLMSVDLTNFPNIQTFVNLKLLELSNNNFQKLPEYIGNFSNLLSLSIMDQENLVSLPDSIGNLRNLKILNIESNKKLKYIPNSMCNIKELRCLFINKNKVLTTLPEDIGLLLKLECLHIEYNNLGTLPISLGRLKYDTSKNVPMFYIGFNSFKDPELRDKASVEILDIMKREWESIEKRRIYKTKFILLEKIMPGFPIVLLAKIIDDQYKGGCLDSGYDIISTLENEKLQSCSV